MNSQNNLCITTGWCSHEGGNNPKVDARMFESTWLFDTWRKYIELWVKPRHYYIYVSDCGIFPEELNAKQMQNTEFNFGVQDVTGLDHRHDFHCSLMMGAQFALCNGMDMLFIEQDCLVYNLSGVVNWAYEYGKEVVYGFDPWTFCKGWAEQSLIFVRNYFLPTFIYQLNNCREIYEGKWGKDGVPEVIFHSLFKQDAVFWPFGFGRYRPIDFSEEMFYGQQLSEEEVNKFLSLVNLT